MIIPACFAQRASPAEMAAPFGSSRLGVGLVTALVWALAAGSALYWGLRASQPVAPVLPLAGRADGPAVDTRAVARALGAPDVAAAPARAPVPAIASRLKLSGVVTHGAGGAVLLVERGCVGRRGLGARRAGSQEGRHRGCTEQGAKGVICFQKHSCLRPP